MSASKFHTSSVFMGTGPNVHQRYCKQIENRYRVTFELQNVANVKYGKGGVWTLKIIKNNEFIR